MRARWALPVVLFVFGGVAITSASCLVTFPDERGEGGKRAGETGGTGTGGLASGGGGAAGSSSGGTCVSAAQCGTDTPCVTFTCIAGQCGNTMIPQGTACPGQAGVCDPDGECVQCFQDGATVYGCMIGEACVAAICASCVNGTKDGEESDVDCGGSCAEKCGIGQSCLLDGDCGGAATECSSGQCTSCKNGEKDGNESAADCGGSCAPCGTGATCNSVSDCANGVCSDGVCCDADCSGQCASCVLPGHTGTCTSVPNGEDGTPSCGPGSLCGGAGVCKTSVGAPIGAPCMVNSSCFNNNCAMAFCRLPNGDACNEDIECASGRCAANTCAACAAGADCASGKCNAGACALPSGYLCGSDSDCAIGNCAYGFCTQLLTVPPTPAVSCTVEADCAYHRCVNNACVTCNQNSDCESGRCSGTNGYCFAPSGDYCTSPAQCASNVCVPSPHFKKCQ